MKSARCWKNTVSISTSVATTTTSSTLSSKNLKTSFVISGGGGARVYGHDHVRENTFIQDVNGFSHLSFRNSRLLLRHIDPNGKVVHAFSKGVNHDWKVEA